MAWAVYDVVYELRSPLHVGYAKIGNLQRTRYYLPARNLWGAVTEALTRRGFLTDSESPGDYPRVGEWVKAHCAFGYWFVHHESQVLSPCYKEKGLYFGSFSAAEFERCYLASHVTTAVNPDSNSAEEGSLHEVEYIAPYARDAQPTRIGGQVFLDETAQSVLGDEEKWRSWLGDLHVGGGRRYGFGELRLNAFSLSSSKNWVLSTARPRIYMGQSMPLPAHVNVQGVKAKGQIEPWLGLETAESTRFGMRLTPAVRCWVPGSILEEDGEFEIHPSGIWQKVD